MKRRIRWTLLAVAVAGGGGALYLRQILSGPLLLDAPPPEVVADSPDSLAAPRASIVEAPISYDLSAAVDSLEAAVPRDYGDIEERLQAGNNKRAHFAFAVSRSPFRVRSDGLTVTISTDVEYEARGWYRPIIGPELSAACGTGGVPRPRVRATLVSSARITPDWQVVTRTRVKRLEPYSTDARDHCRVTIFHIDVTGRVIEATQRMLERNLARFDRSVSRWDAKSWFEHVWLQLERPIRFADSIYMVINPFAAQLGDVTSDGNVIVGNLRLIASPRVLTGPRPDEGERMRPLPRLERVDSVGTGAIVLIDASFTYPVATGLLRKALVGRWISESGRRVRIRDVTLSGIGGGRVALGVTLGGSVRGRLFLTGTPSLDRASHQVFVPDLDYDVGSADLLVRGFEWLQGDEMRDFLRQRARLPDSALLGKLSVLAERGMNRTLTPGVDLSARIFRAEGTAVRATIGDIRLRALADAELKLQINKAPTLPRPRSREPGR